ncbi:MAG: molecular chaperone DnaK, partial [Clostridiales bacterium]|nr:molecular chaperone DnaK [Clostridiales bacterium]
DKHTVQSEIDAFKKVREGNKADEIKPAMDQMTQKVYEIFGKLYQQEGQQGQPGDTGDQQPMENPDGSVNADGEVH